MVLRMKVRLEGVQPVLRAFSKLPKDAQNVMKDGSFALAQSLVPDVKASAAGAGRQAARAATSVKAARGRAPVLSAGTGAGALASNLLFGSEFGATRHFGWYARPRYFHSVGKQFPPHSGASSYWFFRSVDAESGRIGTAYLNMAQDICEKWGTG